MKLSLLIAERLGKERTFECSLISRSHEQSLLPSVQSTTFAICLDTDCRDSRPPQPLGQFRAPKLAVNPDEELYRAIFSSGIDPEAELAHSSGHHPRPSHSRLSFDACTDCERMRAFEAPITLSQIPPLNSAGALPLVVATIRVSRYTDNGLAKKDRWGSGR